MISGNPLGFVNFDPPGTRSGTLEIMIPQKTMHSIRLGQYVRIKSDSDGTTRNFLGRIVEGPFYKPDAVSRDSAFAKASILQAGSVKFRPDYHALCSVQIVGELNIDEMKLYGTFIRPKPQAAVYAITADEIEKLLELKGDMYLGQLDGYPSVKVYFPSNKNAALPRNLGIFGTVGSGKTNTSQVFIEEAARNNWAVIVLDIEGEYVDMDKPSKEKSLLKLMKQFAIEPSGVEDLDVYHPVNTDSSRSDSRSFSVRFSNIEPGILAEIMELSGPQNERFTETWYDLLQNDHTKKKNTREPATFIRSVVNNAESDLATGITLEKMIERVTATLIDPATKGPNKISFSALRRKLKRLQRYDIFDKEEKLIDYTRLLEPNKISVIDLSSSINSRINNIVVMDILRQIFSMKLEDKNKKLPSVLIVIEEAHTLVSKGNASKMEETLDILREISRRGRKRWISLCFISQQPSHLPSEIYELCNTKIAHQTTGGNNLDAIKSATGGVEQSIWDSVPRLGQGKCLFISSYFKNNSILVNVRPCMSKRRHVEEE